MKVQTFYSAEGHTAWMVIGDDFKPIAPISSYLKYLTNLDRSPLTIKNRAFHLKTYWIYLSQKFLNWDAIQLEELAEYIHWLKNPEPSVCFISEKESARTANTINVMMSTIYDFYDFHQRSGRVKGFDGYEKRAVRKSVYKPFLHGIGKNKANIQSNLLKLKEPKHFPGCLSYEEVKRLIDACNLIRDKFLIALLYESGMRIGEALGLRHEDLKSSGENEIHISPRTNNVNGVRVKNLRSRVIAVSKELMQIYSAYLVNEYPEDIDCDYVFVTLKAPNVGNPLNPSNIQKLFNRLKRNTGIKVNPHLLRHTHATELIQAGWGMAHVQKRLGHADIQTTVNTYIHLSNEDMKKAYKSFLAKKETDGAD